MRMDSKEVLQRELDLALSRGACDVSRRRCRDVRARVAELRRIRQIEELGAQLDSLPFADPKALVNGDVTTSQARPAQDVPSRGAKGIAVRHSKRLRVVPALERWVVDAAVRQSVRPV